MSLTTAGAPTIARYDYAAQWRAMGPDVRDDLLDVLRYGPHVLGRRLAAFEESFAAYQETGFCVGLNSGTDALVMALRILGIGPGDEVVTQANTFHATVSAIVAVGARPVLVDATADTWSLDIGQLRDALTPATKAILPVHMYGYPAPMSEIMGLARDHGLLVVEDCAQAHGATVGGRKVGTFGDVGCFSFHPSKNLAAAGDGGALVTPHVTLADKARRLRNLGQTQQNHHVENGWNTRLDEVQAVLLRAKLQHLDAWNGARARVVDAYRAGTADCAVRLQPSPPHGIAVHHLVQVMTANRDEFVEHLRARGIDAVVRYPVPVHRQPAFTDVFDADADFPVASRIAQDCCCLPVYPSMAPADVERVVEAVRSFYASDESS